MSGAERFDVVVIGCGPAGERAAIQAARAGRRVAVVERAHVVGGTGVNWGTIPSKTLRESALFVHALTRARLHGIRYELGPEITVADFTYRQRLVVQRELELINEGLAKARIEVRRGHARFLDPHAVALFDDQGWQTGVLEGEIIVIATGSSPNHPPDVSFDDECVFDSSTILTLPRMPRSMLVLGAGVIGIEYASIFAALGVRVTLVDTRDRLLPYLDREIVGILERELARLGIVIIHDDRYETIQVLTGKPPQVMCRTRKGVNAVTDVLLYCVGRDGNTVDLGLETVGLQATAYGLLPVNESFQTTHPHIYAVGDVIGYPALASTSMEQGRQAIRQAFGISSVLADTEALPFAIYSIPEVSYVGATEETLQEQGVPYLVGRGRYEMSPRGQIIGDTEGVLKLLCEAESGRLLGVHIVGTAASELIHIGQAYMRSGATVSQIAESLFNYPTLADLYRHAALRALAELRRRSAAHSPKD
ncbi:MAG: Si-specific NAD(P)(+) transhydrogenase [Thermoanaerobaculaceae bacterium]|jgi:NAD(P) transhydrogenase|nr:Si-specific NAD(P)(+) transhydrogenase [Thermoanaerobaculaceae bacterium]